MKISTSYLETGLLEGVGEECNVPDSAILKKYLNPSEAVVVLHTFRGDASPLATTVP